MANDQRSPASPSGSPVPASAAPAEAAPAAATTTPAAQPSQTPVQVNPQQVVTVHTLRKSDDGAEKQALQTLDRTAPTGSQSNADKK